MVCPGCGVRLCASCSQHIAECEAKLRRNAAELVALKAQLDELDAHIEACILPPAACSHCELWGEAILRMHDKTAAYGPALAKAYLLAEGKLPGGAA